MARPFDGKPVSAEWHVVLSAARADGVRFRLNSGQRTMAQQRALYATYLAGGTLAAVPSANAPHIRVGRADHAIDVSAIDGGAARLAHWLRSQGAAARFTVPGEPWHIEVPAGDLRRLAARLSDPLADYPADERRWIRELDELVRNDRDAHRRQVLRRVMTARRKSIWRAAQRSGWAQLHRVARYRSLNART